jgi:two-component system, cell cycle response regulator
MGSPSQGPPTALSFPPERAKAVARPHLVVLSGPELGKSFELDNQPVELGRDPSCGLILTSEGVSRKHARVQMIFALYFVSDLGSTNGTFVNDQPANMAQLKDGDQIRMGDAVVKFVTNHVEVQYSQGAHDRATTDSLTSAANKQQFQNDLELLLKKSHASGEPLSLALLDVDHFKHINDSWGHEVGDAVLASVATAIGVALPQGSGLYRVGGEEFAILFPRNLRSDALAAAERIRAAVAVEPIHHEGTRIPVTISIGVAQLGDGETPSKLYERADQLLYKSKLSGRNRVS